MAKKPEVIIVAYKCVRASGCDFRTGKVDYAAALASGVAVEILDAAPANGSVCGHSLHVSDTPHKTIQFAKRSHRPWRWFEGEVAGDDVIEKDEQKMRVRRFKPLKEIGIEDIFGADFARRIKAVAKETKTWKKIPWLKPSREITEAEVAEIIGRWRDAITPWLRNKEYVLPISVKIVHERAAAAAAAADAAAAAAAAAADDAADAAAAAAAAAADAADADDAADAAAALPFWLRWYVRPQHVLWRAARWQLAGMTQPNPWTPLVELYRLGGMPIGFVRGEFVVYCPKPK